MIRKDDAIIADNIFGYLNYNGVVENRDLVTVSQQPSVEIGELPFFHQKVSMGCPFISSVLYLKTNQFVKGVLQTISKLQFLGDSCELSTCLDSVVKIVASGE